MSMHIDGRKVAAMHWGGRKIREAWYEGRRVFSGKPVEVMPPTVGSYDAMDWLRATLTEYGESHETVKELPFEIDSSQVTNMLNMFQNCYALTSVPAMDTRNVTYMGGMFRGCSSLTSVPDMDTRNVTFVGFMFSECSSLTDGGVRLIGKHPNVNTAMMINGSGLTREPFYDINGQPI